MSSLRAPTTARKQRSSNVSERPARRPWGELGLALAALSVTVTCAQWGRTRAPESRGAASARPLTSAAPSGEIPSGETPSEVTSEATGANGSGVDAGASKPGGGVLAGGCGAALPSWRKAVEAYRNGRADATLRVLWFGDSHAAADYWPAAVRRALAPVVPTAGPGYVAFAAPSYRHGMVRVWQDGPMEMAPHPAARRSLEDDGVFGLGGTRLTLKEPSAQLWLKPTFDGAAQSTLDYELWYRASSPADKLVVTTGSNPTEIGASSDGALAKGLSRFRFTASGDTRVEIRAKSGKPQLFGVVVETKGPGLVIDTLGINGARYGTFLAWEPESFTAAVAARRPAVAVVEYGTNEVFDDERVSRHAQRLEQVVGRLRAAVPDIGCIVVGPTDVSTGGDSAAVRVLEIDQAERTTAERLGCGYFSPYELISAEGGHAAWQRVRPPLAVSDGIHLTARGYARLGEALAARCLLDGR